MTVKETTVETLEAVLIELREARRNPKPHFLLVDSNLVDRVIEAIEQPNQLTRLAVEGGTL